MLIPQLMLGVCNACQLNCAHCAHVGRLRERSYQMPLEDLDLLLGRLRDLSARVDLFLLNGPGEPLLWRKFNAGIRRLDESGLSGRIRVVTNGVRLDVIDPDVWPRLEQVHVSSFGQTLDDAIIASHAQQAIVTRYAKFHAIVPGGIPACGPASCTCYGPWYYQRHIFPWCGPPVIEAAALAGERLDACSVPVEQWLPEAGTSQPKLPCEWCWANGTATKMDVVCNLHTGTA